MANFMPIHFKTIFKQANTKRNAIEQSLTQEAIEVETLDMLLIMIEMESIFQMFAL